MDSKYSKCFNIYCRGQEFNVGNLVRYRLNPQIGIGRIIKIIEIPVSKNLDGEDTGLLKKYKVIFPNKQIKIIHPIDLIHEIYEINEKIITKTGIGVINSKDFLSQKGKISYEVLFENGKKEQISEREIFNPVFLVIDYSQGIFREGVCRCK